MLDYTKFDHFFDYHNENILYLKWKNTILFI